VCGKGEHSLGEKRGGGGVSRSLLLGGGGDGEKGNRREKGRAINPKSTGVNLSEKGRRGEGKKGGGGVFRVLHTVRVLPFTQRHGLGKTRGSRDWCWEKRFPMRESL